MTLGSIEKLKKSWYFSFKARVKSALPHHSLLSHFHLFCLALCTPFSGFLSVPEASQAPSCCQKRSFLKSLPTQFLLILEEPGETSPQRVLSYYFLLCPSYSPSQLNCFFLDSCYNTQLIYLLVSILFFFFCLLSSLDHRLHGVEVWSVLLAAPGAGSLRCSIFMLNALLNVPPVLAAIRFSTFDFEI